VLEHAKMIIPKMAAKQELLKKNKQIEYGIETYLATTSVSEVKKTIENVL